jgi:serine/threonine protein kinase
MRMVFLRFFFFSSISCFLHGTEVRSFYSFFLSYLSGDHYINVPMVRKSEKLFNFLVPLADIKLGQELGKGAYGVVYKATLKGETIACKMLSKEATAQLEEDAFLQEARTMSEIAQHPNVIRFVGFCRGDKICILSGK